MTVVAHQHTLTDMDRCDRCGAQAYAVTRHDTTDLLWCAHHLRENYDRLAPNLVHDETGALAPTEPVGS